MKENIINYYWNTKEGVGFMAVLWLTFFAIILIVDVQWFWLFFSLGMSLVFWFRYFFMKLGGE